MDYTWLKAILVGVALTLVAALFTSIYLHRTRAHRAFVLKWGADLFFRLVLWFITNIGRQQWVAVHRKHHKFTDKEGDPHSPILKGLRKIQLYNVYYYAIEANNPATIKTFGSSEGDLLERWVFGHKYFKYLGVVMGTMLLCHFLGWWGLLAAALHAVSYIWVLSASINGFCHVRGYKNFKDSPGTNLRLLALLTGGEALHNNHHAFPKSPKFSVRPSEFDPSWAFALVLYALGLLEILEEPMKLPA